MRAGCLGGLIFDGVAACGNGPQGFNSVHYYVCNRVRPMLPPGALLPGGRIHARMVELIHEGRLSYGHGRLTVRETVEQHRCRSRTFGEAVAVAEAEFRRGLS